MMIYTQSHNLNSCDGYIFNQSFICKYKSFAFKFEANIDKTLSLFERDLCFKRTVKQFSF
jgi:hypothetical protein